MLSFSYDGWRIKTENSVQDCPNSWCIVKTQDHGKTGKTRTFPAADQNDEFLGHFNLPVRNMDPYSRVKGENTSCRNEMLSKTFEHLLQGSCYKWRSEEHYQACYWAVWRSYHYCEKTQNEMVWTHNKMNRTCKDDPTGHGTRREKERQTEKEMGR